MSFVTKTVSFVSVSLVSLSIFTSTVLCEVSLLHNNKPRTTVVVEPGQVYNVKGVPADAGIFAFDFSLKVFAILFPLYPIYNYPNAIASAVASSVVAIVPVAVPNVNVTSLVDAGPINVTLFVPLSLSSKNSMKPADVEPFFTDKLASCTSFCEKGTTPLDAIVIESASLAAPIVPPSLISISSTNVTIPVDAIVIAEVELATPIVPPSLINISS